MLKHVARHNQQRAIIVFRSVPGEEHMALIVYSGALPKVVHDDLMKCVESDAAQSTPDLSNVLHRTLGVDGENLLTTLHKNHWIKKVPTNQVIVTPTLKTTIRLDELNKLLTEMAQGEDAVKRMAELDASKGMVGQKKTGKSKVVETEVGVPPNSRAGEVDIDAIQNSILSDADLAEQRLTQAADMKKQAEQLLAEAKRLEQEANELTPTNAGQPKAKKASRKKQEA